MKKFAYQRFEPSGFTKNPDIRNATSITDYVFRWLGCQFIQGYKEATSPNRSQSELPMKEIPEMEKKAINRPVPDLPRTAEKELIDVVTNHMPNEGTPHVASNGHTHAERVQEALGQHVHGYHLLALRKQQSDSRGRLRRLHRMRHEPGMQLSVCPLDIDR